MIVLIIGFVLVAVLKWLFTTPDSVLTAAAQKVDRVNDRIKLIPEKARTGGEQELKKCEAKILDLRKAAGLGDRS